MSRINFLGFSIDNWTLQETIAEVESIIKKKEIVQHVVLNVCKIVQANEDINLKNSINSCRIINADGMPIIWLSRLGGRHLKERVAGIDLMEALVRLSANKKYKLYFLGAREEVVKDMVNRYMKRYPQLNIVGFRNGYWLPEEEPEVVSNIQNSRPDILFVGMSSPRKEHFLSKYLKEMEIPFSMGVGGSFDVIAGKVKRAPRWMQNAGLEWIFRIFQEPSRLLKKYLTASVKFSYLLFKQFSQGF